MRKVSSLTALMGMSLIISGILLPVSHQASGTGQVSPAKHYTVTGDYETVFEDVKDAVINKGLVIDYVGHIGKMLERTGGATGSVTASGNASPFKNAQYLQFCSAKLTHQAVSANPMNLAICPYVVFIYETRAEPGKVVVGYRRPVSGPSKRSREAIAQIDQLLDSVVKEAGAN